MNEIDPGKPKKANMSQKITSKNLSYDSSLPPFLARMQAQASGHDDTPSQSQQRNRRLGKKRSDSEEAEDAPLVVDEEGNLVEVEIDKEGGVKKRPDGDAEGGDGQGKEEEVAKEKEGDKKGVEIGMRKRKVGRVVGGDDEDGDRAGSKVEKKEKVEDDKGDGRKKGKKKAKKIKLSFDEEEG